MKGTVLGFDGTSGAINGEDGRRYAFERANWKGDKLPQPRDSVDFVADGGKADQIYLLRGGAFAGGDLQGAVQDGLARASEHGFVKMAIERAQAMPSAAVALAMLLASFLFNFATFGGGGKTVEASLIGMPSALGTAQAEIEFSAEQIEGMGDFARNLAGDKLEALSGMAFILSLSWVLYLVPIAIAWVLYRAYAGKRSRLAEIALAAAAFVAAGYYWLVREVYAGMGDGMWSGLGDVVRAGSSFGLGGWLTLLGGVAVLLMALGVVKLGAREAVA